MITLLARIFIREDDKPEKVRLAYYYLQENLLREPSVNPLQLQRTHLITCRMPAHPL